MLTLGLVLAPNFSAHAETQGFLSVRGTQIVNADQEVVLLRGVNYPAYERGDSYDGPRLHSEADYAKFARNGFNIVRLPISWALLEPAAGIFDISYLTRYVNRDVQWAKKYGLYIVLDMHQYKWAEKFGGSGVPDWMVKQYAPTEAGMRKAVSDFWADDTLQDHFLNVWTQIARIYANETTIAGYDILNEPWVYTSVIPYLNATYVDTFYLKVVKSIRTVDPNHIIILEPANINTFKFPLKENIVWSPHFYPLAFASRYSSEDVKRLEADLAAKYKRYVVELGSPMWIGEFGAFMDDQTCRNNWLQDAIGLFDKYQVGWTWWAFPEDGRRSIPNCLSIG
jgi:endoglycosylceramidase